MFPDIARIARISHSRALGLGFGLLTALTATGLALASTQRIGYPEDFWRREYTVQSHPSYGRQLAQLGRQFEVHAKTSRGLFSRAKSTADREVASELYRISFSTSGVMAHVDDLYHLGVSMETETDGVRVRGYLHARVVWATNLLSKSIEQIDHENADVRSDDVLAERAGLRRDLQEAKELLQSLRY